VTSSCVFFLLLHHSLFSMVKCLCLSCYHAQVKVVRLCSKQDMRCDLDSWFTWTKIVFTIIFDSGILLVYSNIMLFTSNSG